MKSKKKEKYPKTSQKEKTAFWAIISSLALTFIFGFLGRKKKNM